MDNADLARLFYHIQYPLYGKFYDFNSKLVPVLDRDFNGKNPDEIV